MSSMIKKKGALSFKPKAPQARRPPGVLLSSRESSERQSQTPAPTAISPPPIPTHRDVPDETPSLRDAATFVDAVLEPSSRPLKETNNAASTSHTIPSYAAEDFHETGVQAACARKENATAGAEDNPSTSLPTSATVSDIPSLGCLSTYEIIAESSDTNEEISQNDPVLRRTGDDSVMGLEESIQAQAAAIVPTADLNPDGTSGAFIGPVLDKASKRPAKRRKLNKDTLDVRQSIEVQLNKPRRIASAAKKARGPTNKGTKRKRRAETPEDAEDLEIDHSTVKMSELTKDLRIGKKFSRHAEIKKRQTAKKGKAKLAKDHPGLVQGQANAEDASSPTAAREGPPPEASTGPQMRIVNGQIVIDDDSLVVDRHARDAADETDMEIVEEDDFTRITTSGTHMKRELNVYWDVESTDKFYNGIRMFGTDFEMISQMFPERNRRQIKLKFKKEEREFPRKISNALIGEVLKMDLEEYKSHTGLEYEATDDIEAEHAQLEAEHEAEQLRLQTAADESTRQKRAEIQAGAKSKGSNASTAPTGTGNAAEPAASTDSAKENEPVVATGASEGGKASAASKSKKKAASKKKRKNIHSNRAGGEEVEVLGSIDDLQT